MSVVIRGMKMPTSCSECAFCGYYGKGDHMCDITGKDVVYELSLECRLDDCPLVELPPHGRLIDADIAEVIVTDEKDDVGGFLDGILYAADWIANQPTIIEADEEQTTVCSATDCEHNVDGVCKKNAKEVSE